MKIIYNSLIPFEGFKAINICGLMFVRNEYKNRVSDIDINHESIHTEQMKELGYIFFYLWYFIEWIIRLFINENPYRSISFEREAYCNLNTLDYLQSRPRYNWIHFLIL